MQDDLKITLHKRDGTQIANLIDIRNPVYLQRYNGINEINFTVPFLTQNNFDHELAKNPLVEQIKFLYLLKLNDQEYFIIDDIKKESDDTSEKLEIKAYGLGYELRFKNLREYKTGVTEKPVMNLTGTITDMLKGTNWTVGTVTPLLDTKYRAISISDKTILDSFNDICEKWDCVISYDTIHRRVNFADYRTDGYDLGLVLSPARYLKNVSLEMNKETIFTKLKVYGKDNISIQAVNPTGQNYITDYSFFMNGNYMSQGLISALQAYDELVQNAEVNGMDYTELLAEKTVLETESLKLENQLDIHENDSVVGLIAMQKALDVNNATGSVPPSYLDIETGSVSVATTTALTIPSLIGNRDDFYNTLHITITEGAGAGQVRTVSDYDGTNKVVTVSQAFNPAPDNTSRFRIYCDSIITELNRRQAIVDAIEEEIENVEAQIDVIDTFILTLREMTSLANNFTPEQIKELNDYTIEGVYQDNAITEKGNTLSVLQELMEEAKKFLSLRNQIKYSAELDLIDFLSCEDTKIDKDRLKIGSVLYVKHPELSMDVRVKVVEIERNYDDHNIKIKIANEKDIKDGLAMGLIKAINSIGSIMSINLDGWNSGKKANDAITTFLEGAIDTTTQEIRAGAENSVQINGRGITIVDPTNPQYVQRFTAGAWGLSTDSGETFRTGASRGVIHAEAVAGDIIIGKNGLFNAVYCYDNDDPDTTARPIIRMGKFVNDLGESVRGLQINGGNLEILGGLPEYMINGSIYVRGTGANRAGNRILRVNNTEIYNQYSGRGLRLTVLNRTTLSVLYDQTFDVVNSDVERDALATQLNGIAEGNIIVLSSFDSIVTNANLQSAIANIGGTGSEFGTADQASVRVPYVLIGSPNIGKGSGIEMFTSDSATASYAEISTRITNGIPLGFSSNSATLALQAQEAAQKANTLLADISDDSKLTPVEKLQVKTEWGIIQGERPMLDAQAGLYNVTTQRTAYTNAYNTLNTYITPLLADVAETSDIVRNTFRTNFANYYTAKITLMNAITDALRNSTVQLGVPYNNVRIDSASGLTVENNIHTVKTTMNATAGFLIENSTNGGLSWNRAVEIDALGNARFTGVMNVQDLYIGGQRAITDGGKIRALSIENLVVGQNVTMGAGATITWSQVTNQPTIIDTGTVTTITRNEISTASIRADQITTGNFSAINSIRLGNNASPNRVIRIRTAEGGDAVIKGWRDIYDSLEIGYLHATDPDDHALRQLQIVNINAEMIHSSAILMYLNSQLVATQDWVLSQSLVARFG